MSTASTGSKRQKCSIPATAYWFGFTSRSVLMLLGLITSTASSASPGAAYVLDSARGP